MLTNTTLNNSSQYCCFTCILCVYILLTPAMMPCFKSSYFQKSSLCKCSWGKTFLLFHVELFSTEAERKRVRLKEAERREKTSCFWVTNTFEMADIKVWRMWSLSLSLFFFLPVPSFPLAIDVRTNTHSSMFHLQLARLLREWYWCHFEVLLFECHLYNQVPPTSESCWPLRIRAEIEIERFHFHSRSLPVQLISK